MSTSTVFPSIFDDLTLPESLAAMSVVATATQPDSQLFERDGLDSAGSVSTSVASKRQTSQDLSAGAHAWSVITGLATAFPGLAGNQIIDLCLFDRGNWGTARGGNGNGNQPPSDGGSGGGNDSGLLDIFTSTGKTNNTAEDYNVTVKFEGSLWSQTLQEAFIKAANLVSQIITKDIGHDFRGFRYQGTKYSSIDDIYIAAELIDIDGINGILGQAGPELLATSTELPLTGIMQFDIADAETFNEQGLFDDIVFHEMLHTVGLGTLWSYRGLINGDTYTGANAIEAYQLTYAQTQAYDPLATGSGVNVEDDFGPGTQGGHWEEGPVGNQAEDRVSFGNEIMTGFIDPENYLSTMSIASLEDLGYTTVWSELLATHQNDGTQIPLVYENPLLTGSPNFLA